MHVYVSAITWDTDGMSLSECCLPEVVVVLDVPDDIPNTFDLEEEISQLLSEAFGFCHQGFVWEPLTEALDTHGGGGFYPENLGLCRFEWR